MLTENYLVSDYGFKRRSKNKIKFLFNEEYGITLKKKKDDGVISFINQDNNEEYYSVGDIITIFALINIEKSSKLFHSGLPEQNLKQGNFEETYTEFKARKKDRKKEYFITHDKAKQLLEAQFNRLISTPLMNYHIKETHYKFITSKDNDIVILGLCYNFINKSGNHDFWQSVNIYNFSSDLFPINERVGSYIPIDLIIEKFL